MSDQAAISAACHSGPYAGKFPLGQTCHRALDFRTVTVPQKAATYQAEFRMCFFSVLFFLLPP